MIEQSMKLLIIDVFHKFISCVMMPHSASTTVFIYSSANSTDDIMTIGTFYFS